MQLRKVAVSNLLLALSLYILLPTADEIFIHPVFGFVLSQVFNMPLTYGILLSIIIYRAVGCGYMLGALFVGGKPIYINIKNRIRSRKHHPIAL